MSSNPLPSNTSRFGGCTLTGALSVTTSVRDSISIVHGPKGCAHHNFSLLHTIALEHDALSIPSVYSSGLVESEIIFGGEAALERALIECVSRNPECIFVLSTCIAETIGDDVGAVCSMDWGVPVVQVPTAGFLGGVFQDGVINALCTLSDGVSPGSPDGTVNVIGEKNMEYEVEENYHEVLRLLSGLGLSVNIRFIHQISYDEIGMLGRASVNILRDQEIIPVGNHLKRRFGMPYLESFPVGLAGTLRFLEMAADACGVSSYMAVQDERAVQEELLADFSDLFGARIVLPPHGISAGDGAVIRELVTALGMKIADSGLCVPMPLSPPVGTSGVRRMLHRWRRMIHARV
jgi:nitrogenase molybdenum-iron protein alpha/beta subunit